MKSLTFESGNLVEAMLGARDREQHPRFYAGMARQALGQAMEGDAMEVNYSAAQAAPQAEVSDTQAL